jgi:hypothetical protein
VFTCVNHVFIFTLYQNETFRMKTKFAIVITMLLYYSVYLKGFILYKAGPYTAYLHGISVIEHRLLTCKTNIHARLSINAASYRTNALCCKRCYLFYYFIFELLGGSYSPFSNFCPQFSFSFVKIINSFSGPFEQFRFNLMC